MDLSPEEDNFPGRLLHQAALWDNSEFLEDLIKSDGGIGLVDARDGSGRTPLHAAACSERSSCLQLLLNAGADVNTQSDDGSGAKTALHIAAERGHAENVRALLDAGAFIHVRDASGYTPLQVAERGAHTRTVVLLRDATDALDRQRLAVHNELRQTLLTGDLARLKSELTSLGQDAELIVNLAPGGASTLLYIASEMGAQDSVAALIASGADGRCHPVTAYSPLYAACYRGHVSTVYILLNHFPQLCQKETVEKWLPIHAACIGGHASIVTLLLTYKYPDTLLQTFTDPTSKYTYRAAFDVNHRDVSGQTPLYVAATLGNLQVVEALLTHNVPVADEAPTTPESCSEATPEMMVVDPKSLSSSRKRISRGIQNIMCRLTSQSSLEETRDPHRIGICDVNADCGGDTCLGAAVRYAHRPIVAALLRHGADVNATCGPPADLKVASGRVSRSSRARSTSAPPRRMSAASPSPCRSRDLDLPDDGVWCPLSLAVATKAMGLAELLIRAGATDPTGKAIGMAANTPLLPMLLAIRAYVDSEFKINKKHMTEAVFGPQRSESTSLTFNAVYPSKPTMVDWHDLRCGITEINVKWLRQAVMHVNTQLSSAATALHAITRIDISNNQLRALPKVVFTLTSLRFLNVSKNKLERLPGANDPDPPEEMAPHRSKGGSKPKPYSAPSLNTLFLQDNRLEELPQELFTLPALTNLDVSNNKLRRLPSRLWLAPSLTDLNASFNHLRDLPLLDEQPGDAGTSSPSILLSPTEQRSSVSSSSSTGQIAQKKSMTPSPSLERTQDAFDFATSIEEEDNVCVVENREGYAIQTRPKRMRPWSRQVEARCPPSAQRGAALAPLSTLELAHNALTQVPRALACLAPNLTRLSLAYNSLRSMSYVTSYPLTLRQLDLSHNEITCWPSLPQIETVLGSDPSPLACYCPGGTGARPSTGIQQLDGSFRNQVLTAVCPARGHLRLENLRTLILANNLLTRIQLTTDDDGQLTEPGTVTVNSSDSTADEDDEWSMLPNVKSRLLFPHLSMLDVSCNIIRNVPPSIHELASLSVLNLSGNKELTDLPPQMGLLSRLWNLNTSGCPLHEPLKSMIESKKYKTMDIVGYLKSVLEDAQTYTRMKLMVVGVQGIGKTSLLERLKQETTPAYRRRSSDHWAKRMGNKAGSSAMGKNRGANISTVGVDIATWQLDTRDSRGPITFRTWDFGGQQEYYATHQYFLSRRSLYVVAWRGDAGRAGARDALRWLRTIHARAPHSPVILVATHYDLVQQNGLPDNESFEALQREIRARILCACDADKLGLPRVIDSIEVSCVTGHNIRLLADIIYDAARTLRPPGSKEPLLEQRIPASYLALEECVAHLAAERRSKGLEPVLRHDQFKQQVTQYMQSKGHKPFRDSSELHQATMFLHENGVMLHYDDSTLKELYFLEPQWLCDMLAHVVTIREINPFARTGIMKLDDLAHVLKSSPLCGGGEESRALLVSLLNKFELALAWDGRNLIVPPLLPSDDSQTPLKVSLKPRPWLPGRWSQHSSNCSGGPTSAQTSQGSVDPRVPAEVSNWASVWGRSSPERAYQRLVVVSYIPPGFWPRLITRLLADESIADAVHTAYIVPDEVNMDAMTLRAIDLSGSWQLWQTGATLHAGDIPLCSVRERRGNAANDDLFSCYESSERFRIKQDGIWCDLDVSSSTVVEIYLPAEVLVVRRQLFDEKGEPLGCQNISVEANPEVMAKLLAVLTDHVDLLLEDWYPSLGTRFVHTSEGRCLVTRAIPCPRCIHLARNQGNNVEPLVPQRMRGSQDSRASDQDSGVGAESNSSSRLPSMEGHPNYVDQKPLVYSWCIEECILAACGGIENCSTKNGATVACPAHGDLMLANVAPDTLLLDFGPCLVRWDRLRRLRPLGRGAFGVVLGAEWDVGGPPGMAPQPVAVKLLQPVPPPSGASHSELQAYKAARSRWQRSPCAAAARAYCALRGEATLLRPLRHVHVPPLLGVCRAPLALILPKAPEGALDAVLRRYASRGCRVMPRVARQLALQPARALEYLHARRILYRDLKAENVLVWSVPQPEDALQIERSPQPVNVHVKLGDYGISRLTLPCGAKGFGGTEGFMAPEIMKYNGEEEYTEKVDCFSYGMFLYEIITLRQPFEENDAIKESVLVGARPTFTPKDTEFPYCVLETMWSCWNGTACARPSGSALVSLASAPEYVALRDVAEIARQTYANTCASIVSVYADGETCVEVWIGLGNRLQLMLATQAGWTRQHSIKIKPDVGIDETPIVTAVATVGREVWVGDNCGRITAYSASNCALLWRRRVAECVWGGVGADDAESGSGTQSGGVAALAPLTTMPRVAVALEGGRLFLVCSSELEMGETFVSTELGSADHLFCLTTVHLHESEQLWCGGPNGTLWWYSFDASGVREADILYHDVNQESHVCDKPNDITLCAADPEDGRYVFTYLRPGCIVHQWSTKDRRLVARLDCSKLVPCSESLKSICIEEHLSVKLCQVSSMSCLGGKLYVGSSWGCVIVVEADTLRPITVFRPHEGQVSSLIATRDKKGEFWVASVGCGYRSLISRYVETHSQQSQQNSSGSYALLWLGEHWAAD